MKIILADGTELNEINYDEWRNTRQIDCFTLRYDENGGPIMYFKKSVRWPNEN